MSASEVSNSLYWIKQKLNSAVKQYFLSQGYELEEINALHLYSIEFDDNPQEEYTDIYLNAELTIEEFMNAVDSFDEIVQAVDASSYFDPVQPGIYLARIYWSSIDKSYSEPEDSILNQDNLTKFGELVTSILEDDLDEDFWVDEIALNSNDTRLYVEVSSQNYESLAYVDIEPLIIASYQDLKDLYLEEIVNRLKENLVEV